MSKRTKEPSRRAFNLAEFRFAERRATLEIAKEIAKALDTTKPIKGLRIRVPKGFKFQPERLLGALAGKPKKRKSSCTRTRPRHLNLAKRAASAEDLSLRDGEPYVLLVVFRPDRSKPKRKTSDLSVTTRRVDANFPCEFDALILDMAFRRSEEATPP